MDNRVRRAAEYLMDFVGYLTGADYDEIKGYFSEIESNTRFRAGMEENRGSAGGRRFSSWGISPELGKVVYAICRILRPAAVVETGVASGVSSSYILCALEENDCGVLYSIDLPSWGGSQSGWLIPDYLRHRWQLITGSSSDTLSPLLERLGKIDIFLHDSDHSYRNMMGEFRAAWAHMETGVVLLAHNIDMSDAFPDFCDSVRGKKTTLLRDTGGIVKL